MNPLDHYLLKAASHEKKAFDRYIRNAGVDALRGGGRVLSAFEKNPTVSSAVLGAGVGGAHGAYTADEYEESRLRRALRRAGAGAIAGGLSGGVLSGAVRNLGRYGSSIAEGADDVRGVGGVGDAGAGDFAKVMRERVFNADRFKGRTTQQLQDLGTELERATEAARANPNQANADALKAARKAINDASPGLGTRFNAAEAAAMLGGAGLAGSLIQGHREKTSSARLLNVLEKEANFGALAAKAVGFGAQGAGKAIQMGAANPALAGAAVGAATGAATAGEGNRLKGMLGGAALGAGAGAGLAKLAPQATANMGQFGKGLHAQGKSIVTKAGKEGATFTGSMKGVGTKLKKDTRNFTADNRWAKHTADGGIDRKAMGMSGMAAAGTALAGTAAAGIGAGAVMRGQQKPTQQQQ